jgi:predicted RNA polymerase sigma factor
MSDEVTAAYRAHWARAVAVLCRWTGDVDLAEDAVQDAAEQALRTWPRDGVPDHPDAWLITTARRRAIDGCAATGAEPSGPSCWPGWRRSITRPAWIMVSQRAAATTTS